MILILYIVFIILVLAGVGWLKQKISQRRLTKVFMTVFKDAQIKLPTLKIGSSYSWPTFDITFSAKEDLEFAETSGLIRQFKDRIASRYSKDFDSDRAIYCTYVEHVPSWKVMFDEKTNEKNQGKD